MYEETKSSIDWKGIFLKVIIAFLVILIALQGYKMFKGDNKEETKVKETIAETKSTSTFAANLDKLTEAGEKYYEKNKDKIPTAENTTTMVTLNELINEGYITALVDEEGKNCETESSYVTAELENKKTKIKANLVCGTSFSNASVYMAENDSKTEEVSTVTTNNGSKTETNKTYYSTSNKTNSQKTENKCTESCGASSVEMKTETKVEQNVIINEKPKTTTTTTTKPVTTTTTTTTTVPTATVKVYYKVSFDSNGGTKSYSTQKVYAYDTAQYPGSTYRNGYTFIGWYLNGEKFDFDTPITRNITLTAKFVRNNNYDDYYYDDDYNYDDDYYYDYRSNYKTSVVSKVYTIGWDNKGTDNVSITHTLKVPTNLANNYSVDEIRIKRIEYYQPLNTMALANSYKQNFNKTFFYTRNGGESTITSKNNLSTINRNAVWFNYDNDYKDKYDAVNNGFEVTWNANYVSNQCKTTFDVKNIYTGAYDYNLCGYGIVYEVTWEGISD